MVKRCEDCGKVIEQPQVRIVLAGKLRSGKDMIASYLSLFYGFNTYAFADEMKAAFHRAYPQVPHIPKPRAGYVKFGEMSCEILGDDVWVEKVMRKIDADNAPLVVISDMRKEPEYKRMQAEGFTIIRITAADELRIERAREAGDSFTEADLTGPTEVYIDKITPDYEVLNNLSPDSLYDQIDSILAELGVEKLSRGE
jgi:dephospho-CoA kinase